MDLDLDAEVPRARLALLLKEFSQIEDDREPCRVAYPLAEVLLLLTCATICSCDDLDDIADWGKHHLDVLRRFAEFHHGIPCSRWLRSLVNRLDPLLFGRCFENWIAALWPGRRDLIAIDGKTARRTHDRRKGLKALHTLTAYATNARLALAQLSVPEKTNEITAIPDLLDHLAETGQLAGALVTIDAMGAQADIVEKILAHDADFLLPLKGNQPTLEADVADYFATAPQAELIVKETLEKGHGRIETRSFTASSVVDWIASARSYPGQPRFKSIKTILKVVNRTEYADRCTFDSRLYISSAPLDIERLAAASRGHWGVESFHWLLDIEFKDDLSRYRCGHGAANMAIMRRFALGLVRADQRKDEAELKALIEANGGRKPRNGPLNKSGPNRKASVKTRRKLEPLLSAQSPPNPMNLVNLDSCRGFRSDPACRVFLSTDAGSTGLNLQHASTLVNMDLPWNPAILEQGIARIHRMGQARPVQVINFVAKGTIEEGMLSVLAFKRSLSAGILDGGGDEISLGGSRLNRFMKDIENVTGLMDESEAVTPAEEETNIGSTSAPTAAGDPDAEVDIGMEGVAIARAQSAGASPREAASGPWQALAQVGAQFVAALAAANNPDAPAHPWIERDPTTGVQSLKMPLPPPETARRLANALSALADGLRNALA